MSIYLLELVVTDVDSRVLGSQIFLSGNIHLIQIVPIACFVFSFQKRQLGSVVWTHFQSKDLTNGRRSTMEKIAHSSRMWELVLAQPVILQFNAMKA
jgi:hypothetical protein